MEIKEMNFTKGRVSSNLLKFALPFLGSSFFQQLYSTTDGIIVGKFVGKTGLAAIDSVYNFLKIPTLFFIGISMGATIILSQYYGAGEKSEMSVVAHTIMTFSLMSGFAASLLGIFFAPDILYLLQIPNDIYVMTLSYVQIYFCGLVASLIFNSTAGILRAMGDSRTPFYIMGFACLINVVLDLLFVAKLKMGVAGAAMATIIVQFLGTFIIIKVFMNSKNEIVFSLQKLKIKWEKLKSIVKMGLPLALQSAIYPFANMLIQTRINNTGTDNIAAYALCGKLDFIVWPVTESIGMAVTTFVAQNYGAKLFYRVKQGMKTGIALAVGTITILDVILFIFCEQIGKLFLASCDHNVIPIMAHLLRFLLPFNLFYVVAEILCAVIRGRGETFRPMIITLVCTCGIRVLWIMVAVNQESTIKMILTSYPLSWIINGIAFIVFYRNFAIRS